MSDDLIARCDCGWSARGPEQELIAQIQEHARDAHGLEVTPEEALAQARPVEPGGSGSAGRPGRAPADRDRVNLISRCIAPETPD